MNYVSVIIPTRNRSQTLSKVLPSYLNQDGVLEIIIIDDYSKSDEVEAINKLVFDLKDSRVKVLHNESHFGAPRSRNKGLEESSGKYIFMGEDDLVLDSNHISTLVKHLLKNRADIISGRRIWVKPTESLAQALMRANKLTGSEENIHVLVTNCEVDTHQDIKALLVDASMLFKKDIFEKIKYFEGFINSSWREETDFQINAASKGYITYFCPHSVSFHLPKSNDKGGDHSLTWLKHEFLKYENSYVMVKRHKEFLGTKGINLFTYMFKFFVWRLINNYPYVLSRKIRDIF